LRRDRGPGAAGHKDGRQQRSDLPHAADAEKVHHVNVRAEPAELIPGQVTQDHSDEKSNQGQDTHGLGPGTEDSRRNLPYRPTHGALNEIRQIEQQAADECNDLT